MVEFGGFEPTVYDRQLAGALECSGLDVVVAENGVDKNGDTTYDLQVGNGHWHHLTSNSVRMCLEFKGEELAY